jgi:transposase
LGTNRIFWKKTDRGNGGSFISFLRQLLQNNPEKKIAVILDNASQHTCNQTKRFLSKFSRIKLYFLPPYSPEYNPIERFWGWLKKHVYGSRSYDTIDEVISRVRQVMWHHRENRLISTINFSFSQYQKIINN